jgi:hypothetical protein
MLRVGVTAVLFFAATLTAKADIKIERKQGSIEISISGTITESDAAQFRDVSKEFENAKLSVYLDANNWFYSMTWVAGRPPLGARREGVSFVCCLMDLPLAKCPTRRRIAPTCTAVH